MLQELAKEAHTPETEEYGISSLVFRENARPFHPQRLDALLREFGRLGRDDENEAAGAEQQKVFAGVVRSKGQLWLANADAFPIEIHSVGRQLEIKPNVALPYLAVLPQEMWEAEAHETYKALQEAGKWSVDFGDRCSELVCIGVCLDREAIVARLKGALLTDDEMQLGKAAWKQLLDPFFDGKCAEQYFEFSLQSGLEGR